MTFPAGPRLRLLIHARGGGRTMVQLAAEVGVTKQAVYAWCAGLNEPTLSHLRLLARALDVPFAELVETLEASWTP